MRIYNFTSTIIIIYVLFFLLISPLHEFSTMDAWVHSLAVKDFLNTHQIKIPDLCPSSLMFQILWGAFFCLFSGGFSFGMLNLSTFVLSIIGAISFYLILKRLKIKEILCIFGTLCFIINPLYFFLSYTFMLDVSCLSLMLLSILFYLKGLDDDNNLFLFLGSVFSVVSFLIKQFGIIAPLSLFIYTFLSYKKNIVLFKKIIIYGCLTPFFVFNIYLIWNIYFHLPHSLTKFYFSSSDVSFNWYAFSIYKNILREIFILLLYGGLFISPLLSGALISAKEIFKKRTILVSTLVSLFIMAGGTYISFIGSNLRHSSPDAFMPYAVAIIHKWGLGPITIVGDKSIFFNLYLRMIITIISVLSAAAILIASGIKILNIFKNDNRNIIFICGLLSLLFMLFFLPLYGDHNFIYFLPMVILLSLELLEKVNVSKNPIILGLVVMAFYSILGTKDYMNWNEVRWRLAGNLLRSGVPADKIGNGYEWGGLIFSQRAIEKLKDEFQKCPKDRFIISKWITYIEPKYEPKYIISFSPSLKKNDYLDRLSSGETVSGMRSEWNFSSYKKEYYYNALRFRKEPVYILRKEEN